MPLRFSDSLYDAQLLRVLAGVREAGAEVGECLATAARIAERDADGWYAEWCRTAEHCQAYSLRACAAQIRCPTLVCYADGDDIAAQAPQLFAALTCPKQYLIFTRDEGAGDHCESGSRSLFHQRVFDWLDDIVQPEA